MKQIEQRQIKAIWAAAREHGLDRQGIYDVIRAVTGKEHMTELSSLEADKVRARICGRENPAGRRRTDAGGDPKTVPLRHKIYKLTEALGWNDNPARIHGMCKRMFGTERIEWLTPGQCHQLIEALKQIVARPKER